MDVGDEAKCAFEVPFDDLVVKFECGEARFNVGELGGDLRLFDLEQVERDRRRVVGFEELAALVECATLSSYELLPLDPCALAKARDLFEDLLLGLEAKVFAEFDGLVVVLDPPFDDVNQDGALVAARLVALPADADEVGVDGFGPAGGVANDQSAAAVFPVPVSFAAEDGALEIVVVGALLFASEVLDLELPLYLGKCGLVDQGMVFPFVLDAHVAHDADVVRVLEHVVECGEHERLLRAFRGGTADESTPGYFGVESAGGPFSGRVLLEGPDDERGALGIDLDGTNLLASHKLADVAVADGCSSHRTAAFDLLQVSFHDLVSEVA